MSRSSGCPGSLKASPGVVFHIISADFTKLFHAFVRPLFELRPLTAAQRQLEFSFWAARCRVPDTYPYSRAVGFQTVVH